MKRTGLLLLSLALLSLSAWADFSCPMRCEGAKTYPSQSGCPVCGMKLEKKSAGGQALNSRDFRVDVAPEGVVKAGQPAVLKLGIRKTADDSPVADLDVVHEKRFHLIVVSQDLSWFAHEHPEIVGPGDLKVTLTFPFAANFVLYADFTPTGASNQVVPIAFKVDGAPKAAVPLKANANETRKVGEYAVTLKPSPAGPKAGKPTRLVYRVRHRGKDVRDLEPYLGALGHSVIISEDTTRFVHSHPDDHGSGHAHHAHDKGHGAKTSGPEVVFVAVFPKAGLYKAWAQFQHKGKVLTADFVIRVKD